MSHHQDGMTITLDDKPVVLAYTLRAAKLVDAYFGGFTEAYARINRFSLSAFAAVIAAGTSTEAKPVSPSDVEGVIWRTGTDNLHKQVAEYVARLSNGGQPPKPIEDAAPGEA
jgi:hypothetical protein